MWTASPGSRRAPVAGCWKHALYKAGDVFSRWDLTVGEEGICFMMSRNSSLDNILVLTSLKTNTVNRYFFLMFCWPWIIVYQHSETNVMHFLFNLLWLQGLYVFRALLAHPQKALNKWHLVYCMRLMLAGVEHSNPGAATLHNTHAIYQVPLVQHLLRKEQVMLEKCRGP
jgi:hypothetical protein